MVLQHECSRSENLNMKFRGRVDGIQSALIGQLDGFFGPTGAKADLILNCMVLYNYIFRTDRFHEPVAQQFL